MRSILAISTLTITCTLPVSARAAGQHGRPFAHPVGLPAGDFVGEVGVWIRYTYAGGFLISDLGMCWASLAVGAPAVEAGVWGGEC